MLLPTPLHKYRLLPQSLLLLVLLLLLLQGTHAFLMSTSFAFLHHGTTSSICEFDTCSPQRLQNAGAATNLGTPRMS
jgi:hypothetical protein